MILELNIEDPRWSGLNLERLAQAAFAAVLAHLQLKGDQVEISLLACDDAKIAALNSDFRAKPSPTNVLSWPGDDLTPETAGALPDLPQPDVMGNIALGDIAIAWGVCASEAEAAGKEMSDHVSHLLVHGALHLLGYDHIRDPDATLMMKNEVEILGKLGIGNPY